MVQKLLISTMLLVAVLVLGGFAVLAIWEPPMAKKEIEKPVDTAKYLQNKQ